jgi:hypothetical protein
MCRKEKDMSKHTTIFAPTAIIALGVLAVGAKKPVSMAGSWSVDAHHSNAQLITDGTTDYGKTKIDITLGFGRVMGGVKIDGGGIACEPEYSDAVRLGH